MASEIPIRAITRSELLADGCVGVRSALAFTGWTRTFLYQEIKAGRLPVIKMGDGRRTLVPRRALHEHLLHGCVRVAVASDSIEAELDAPGHAGID